MVDRKHENKPFTTLLKILFIQACAIAYDLLIMFITPSMTKWLLLNALALALGACTKADPIPSKTDLLTAKSWRLSGHTSTDFVGGRPVVTDYYALLPLCRKDDFLTFRRDKTILFDEGATKCNPSFSQTSSGQWDWSNFETELNLPTPTGSNLSAIAPYKLEELSPTTLHVSFTLAQFMSSNYTKIDWTYTAL